mmetsp:Transcript_19842/g.28376  ORF Transcript_19842/g.28376 Transcript_19842/m.28376 type:complete len:100 (+) Transcript_19842:129-428(+)
MYSCVVSALAVFLFVIQMACARWNKSNKEEHEYVPILSEDIEEEVEEVTSSNSNNSIGKESGKGRFHSSYQNSDHNLEIVALPSPLRNLIFPLKSNTFN